jgi:hypothetical protein
MVLLAVSQEEDQQKLQVSLLEVGKQKYQQVILVYQL